MTKSILLPMPAAHPATPAKSRHYRSSSGSPTRHRHTDELLAHLTPATALQAFRNPHGPLKVCLDAATASEQSFAMRAGIASKHVQEWLGELSSWPWPTDGGSAGFELPTAKRRRLFASDDTIFSRQSEDTQTQESAWIGSLPAADVARYDKRIAAIQQEMDELDIEEIKRHVLHNHILPLSRPGTPLDMNRPATPSLFSFNKMDDLTAILTTVVLQMLPNLSKLIRLMNTWSVRLVVLKRVPSLLTCLADAEVAIQSGWNAIQVPVSGTEATEKSNATLTRRDFEVMKGILQKKVSKAGGLVDYMLDSLDGREDTIPDEWVDRMDKVEREYSEWVATCERNIRSSEWKKLINNRPILTPPVLTPQVLSRSTSPKSRSRSPDRGRDRRRDGGNEPSEIVINVEAAPEDAQSHVAVSNGLSDDEDLAEPSEQGNVGTSGLDGLEDPAIVYSEQELVQPGVMTSASGLVTSPLDTRIEEDDSQWDAQEREAASRASPIDGSEASPEAQSLLSSKSSVQSLRSQPSLPKLDRERRGSDASAVSTIVNGPVSGLELSSDLPDINSSPRLSVMRSHEPTPNHDASPPSSPPDFRSSVRSTVTFNDMPTVAEIPNEETPPQTPHEPSYLDNVEVEIPLEATSPSRMSMSSEDEHLQQQISDILESIPAKIKLANHPAASYLNPPDLQLPRAKPKTVDPNRSQSAMSTMSTMSSRAGTPAFLLAPAYEKKNRPRQQRGNSDIKLYHLSRSTGEAPIKLFIRLVGENGERVMVRVGGGWADLGEYLKEYASHHGRRSKSGQDAKIEVRDLPPVFTGGKGPGSSPPSRSTSALGRPTSALDSPMTPLNVRKTRRSVGEEGLAAARGAVGGRNPKTPVANLVAARGGVNNDTPSSEASTRSRASSRLSWTEEDSSLGMSGPNAKKVEMSQESRAWVESVKEKVRAASGSERRVSGNVGTGMDGANNLVESGRFGEMDKIGGTKRLFRKKQT